MTRLVATHVILSIFLIIPIGWVISWGAGNSFGVGSILVLLNLLALAWAWSRIFRKKTVALAVGVIVIKYAILGLIIYVLIKQNKVQPVWFLGGLSSIFLSILVYTFGVRKQTEVD